MRSSTTVERSETRSKTREHEHGRRVYTDKSPGNKRASTDTVRSAAVKRQRTDATTHSAALAGAVTTNRISSTMSASEIIALLSQHKCQDVTDQLDLDKCGCLPIAGGGSGDIYQGFLGGGEQVAIKCARLYLQQDNAKGRKALKHTARELYIWSRLRHDNVLAVLGLAQFRGQMAIVSPWMNNGTLLEYIERNPDTDRYGLCIGISGGVAYLHQSNVIHGDIKSGNVLISNEGIAKLADFGCTKALKKVALGFTTTTSTLMFSTRWAAPEILEGSMEQSLMADAYALGMTLLEIITGTIPFPDKQDMAVYHNVAFKKLMPKRPDTFPSFNENEANELWGIMAKLWAHDPLCRPSATAARDLLKNIKLPKICSLCADTTKRHTPGKHKYETCRNCALCHSVYDEDDDVRGDTESPLPESNSDIEAGIEFGSSEFRYFVVNGDIYVYNSTYVACKIDQQDELIYTELSFNPPTPGSIFSLGGARFMFDHNASLFRVTDGRCNQEQTYHTLADARNAATQESYL